MQEPLETGYLHPEPKELHRLPEILFLLMLTACSSLAFDRPTGTLVRLNKNAPDGGVLAVGLTTLLRQLPSSFLEVLMTPTPLLRPLCRGKCSALWSPGQDLNFYGRTLPDITDVSFSISIVPGNIF